MDNKIDIILVQFKKVYFQKEQKNKKKIGAIWVKQLLEKGFIIKSAIQLGKIESCLEQDYLTEKYMMMFGGNQFEFVRGGIYNSPTELPKEQKKILDLKYLHFKGLCFGCKQ